MTGSPTSLSILAFLIKKSDFGDFVNVGRTTSSFAVAGTDVGALV